MFPTKIGAARQHLLKDYSPIPDRELKMGHVFLLLMQHEKSIAGTIHAVNNLLTCCVHPNDMKKVLNQLNGFKHLGRESEMEDFVQCCSEPFTMFVSTSVVASSPAMEPVPSTSDEPVHSAPFDPVPSTSNDEHISTPEQAMNVPKSVRLSRGLTPRKLKLKKRLEFTSTLRSEERKRYIGRVKQLKALIDTPRLTKLKYLRQEINRKNARLSVKDALISKLRHELKECKHTREASSTVGLKQLQRTHQRLKDSNKFKRQVRKCDDSVPLNEFVKVQSELTAKIELIGTLQDNIILLEEEIAELNATKGEDKKMTKKDGKTYATDMRMIVYASIVNQVPTQNIPSLIQTYAEMTGDNLSAVPQRTTVEQMARELDVIADLKAAEVAMKTPDLTIGFDATTQEGVHINSVHLTTKDACEVIAIDELPGGTADDYSEHVCGSVNHLATTYADFHELDYPECRSKIIKNISNTMTDRVVVNHAAIRKVNENWDKTLNELHCHLHPLDTIASSCRSTLKALETCSGCLFGNDCFAGNIVLQTNKFRYKDGKGDPKGFVTFLDDHNLARGIIPRYRGNRLHILFHICGKLFEHHEKFLQFFTEGTVSCGGLQASIRKDFDNPTAILEIQVLGLLGKLLTGPWMQMFYTSAERGLDHVTGIGIVKTVVSVLKVATDDPCQVLTRSTDFFGRQLDVGDATLQKLRAAEPSNKEQFSGMVSACLNTTVSVLERQYKKDFELDISEKLRRETASARSHNIDAEEIMGMFSAGKQRSKHANMDFLRARMRARKNGVVPYLDGMFKDGKDRVVDWAVHRARQKRKASQLKQSEIRKELSRRAALKTQKKVEKERKSVEAKVKSVDVRDIPATFPDLTGTTQCELADILTGAVVGRNICHTWYDADTKERTVYSGRIEKLKRKKKDVHSYTVGYWNSGETYDDAVDYTVCKYELGADLICEDLVLC